MLHIILGNLRWTNFCDSCIVSKSNPLQHLRDNNILWAVFSFTLALGTTSTVTSSFLSSVAALLLLCVLDVCTMSGQCFSSPSSCLSLRQHVPSCIVTHHILPRLCPRHPPFDGFLLRLWSTCSSSLCPFDLGLNDYLPGCPIPCFLLCPSSTQPPLII